MPKSGKQLRRVGHVCIDDLQVEQYCHIREMIISASHVASPSLHPLGRNDVRLE
jgi:DNA-directed RNA polymerase subunit N (RpoN/RPB10)